MKVTPQIRQAFTGRVPEMPSGSVLAAIASLEEKISAPAAKAEAPVVNVAAPVVNVEVPKPERCGWRFDIARDSDGLIKTITATPV